ncbi:TRAP transporter small permease subunit [Ralstonia pickettii]|nr:TRAP transporter small permease subunit [Ralstonia pickettii]
MWSKIEKKVFEVEAFIIVVSLVAMFIAVVIQVIVRAIGMNSIGTTEVGMLAMSILTFIGTSAIIYTKDHITIELEQLIKSERLVYWMKLITTIIMVIFGLIFISVTYTFFLFTLESGEKTIELGIPVAIAAGSMVIGTSLLIFHSISDFMNLIQNNKSKNSVKKGGK